MNWTRESERGVALLAALGAIVLIGVIIAGGTSRTPVVLTEPAVKPAVADRARPARAAAPIAASVVNFADVAERINAAVVNIEATAKGSPARETPRLLRPDLWPTVQTPRRRRCSSADAQASAAG